MIDLENIESYRENNRIEAKTALGGLPHSIWETYSAFANTMGGVILLGVREEKDKSFHTVDLPDPEALVNEFWNSVNDPKTASVNILSAKDVQISTIDGNRIIVINVPKAKRSFRPVYVEGNPLNTYRRTGEGDYKCTKEEYQAMVREASVFTQDMLLLEEMDINVINPENLHEYRQKMKILRPGHVFENLSDEEFLVKLGAAGIGEDGKTHPTGGGLLMFGNHYDIVRVYPYYFLDYRDYYAENTHWNERITSSSGDWSGNLFDFYFRVSNMIQRNLRIPFSKKNGLCSEDDPVYMAVGEALANSIVNADYYGHGGIVVTKQKDRIRFSNPGGFRIDIETAISGGFSDPRNNIILNLFTMIGVGERSGSGIPNIFRVWRENGWQEPEILQTTEPNRTTLTLSFLPIVSENLSEKSGRKNESAIKQIKRQMIISYLTEHRKASSSELSAYLNLSSSRVREYLRELMAENIVVAEGKNRNRKYRLKS